MSEEKTIGEMMKDFIDYGLDISYFKFYSDFDKENFFHMYTDMFESLAKEEDIYSFRLTDEMDLFIEYEGREIYFYILDDYQTLKSSIEEYDPEDYRAVLMLTVMFLTIKELKKLIDMLSDDIIDRMKNMKPSGTPKKLSKNFVGKANHFSSRIEGIMDDIEENRSKVKIKEIE